MNSLSPRQIPLLLLIAALLAALVFRFTQAPERPSTAISEATQEPPASPPLSFLASQPDWSQLEIFQNTITREEFEKLLTQVFTVGDAWRNVIEIHDTHARIATAATSNQADFQLNFATTEPIAQATKSWRGAHELPPAPRDKPLENLHIAIDPGHIGGTWAKMEERWFVVGDGTPVLEGDMTLHVANLLKPQLEALGATVSLVRETREPVTPIRPEGLRSLVEESSKNDDSPASLNRLAERLFYRTAEIRARAELVNQSLKPDLVLCLHFNAEAWGDPNSPTLIDRTHLHLLLNGAYNNEEVLLADQRFAMLQKLLQRTHQEEAMLGMTVADTFAEISGLPPYSYPPDSPNARQVAGHPYLWARNLLANRLYDCPVLFMEPYVMNSVLDHARIQAGDYPGLREIHGKLRPSIFAEYADALRAGLANHYLQFRKFHD